MILHAFWLPDSYVMSFWLEDTEPKAEAAASRKGSALFHPRCTSFHTLSAALPTALDLYQESRYLLLPTHERHPMEADGRIAIGEAELRRWKVTTGETISDCALEYLRSCPVNTTTDGDLEWSPAVRYWRQLVDFALLLVDHQRYVPGITKLEGKLYPCWQATVGRDLDARWQKLVTRMPPVCQALDDPHESLQDHDQIALSFLDATVDYFVRQRVVMRDPGALGARKNNMPLPKQWLEAHSKGVLTYLRGNERSIQRFGQDVATWNGGLRPDRQMSPMRVQFSLQSPDSADGDWLIRFGLASPQDPDLYLDAESIWDGDATAFDGTDIVPQEILLRGLGSAVQIMPKLRDGLRSGQPGHCRLQREEAFAFITDTAVQLERAGFAVRLPMWLKEPQHSLGLKLRLSAQKPGDSQATELLGIEQLVAYRWDFALGDHTLSQQEFRQLVNERMELVYHRGQWTRLDLKALHKTVEFMNTKGNSGTAKLAKAMEAGISLHRAGGLPVIDIQFEGNISEPFLALEGKEAFQILTVPDTFHGQLRHYQTVGFSWMLFLERLGFGACLADDMGLGKTIQMIAVLLYQQQQRDPGPSLVICPMSVVGNWVREFERFSPSLRVMIHHGGEREQDQAFARQVADHDVIVTTYSLIVRDQLSFLQCTWTNIILDEAQNIKNPNTKQTVAIRSLQSHNRFCLTGTPIENRLTELWSIMEFLNPGYLGTLAGFRANFAMPIEQNRNSRQAKVLRKMMTPFILRRLKTDRNIIKDLPEKQEMKVFCNLTNEQASLYQIVVDEMLENIQASTGIKRKGVVLATLTKLKQITNHPVHFLRDNSKFTSARSGKLQRLEEMLDVILQEDDKALIFSQFTEIGQQMQEKLQQRFGVEVCYLHGGTPQWKRDQMVHRFQRENGPPIFLLSLKAGGTGLNLTAASHVFHFDRWWNPAVEDQATDRAYRIGQQKKVQVHKFICVGTVEERIDRMIEQKKRLADNIVTSGDQMIAELSTDELRDLFALSPAAISE